MTVQPAIGRKRTISATYFSTLRPSIADDVTLAGPTSTPRRYYFNADITEGLQPTYLVMPDVAGFGLVSTFGDPANSPTFQELARPLRDLNG